MHDTKRDPFAAAELHGEERLQIKSGGACLVVFDAHTDLQIAWDWFEEGLVDAEHCRISLLAVYDRYISAPGPTRSATFYTDGCDGLSALKRETAAL
jgi:hypothetical protein